MTEAAEAGGILEMPASRRRSCSLALRSGSCEECGVGRGRHNYRRAGRTCSKAGRPSLASLGLQLSPAPSVPARIPRRAFPGSYVLMDPSSRQVGRPCFEPRNDLGRR